MEYTMNQEETQPEITEESEAINETTDDSVIEDQSEAPSEEPEAPKETDVEALKEQIREEVARDLRKQFSKLGRKEQLLKQQMAELEANQAKLNKFGTLEEKLNAGNRAAVLQELGIDIDDLTSDLVSGSLKPKDDPLEEIKAELKALKQEREAERLKQQELAQQQQQSQVTDFLKSQLEESDAELLKAKGDVAVQEIYAAAQEVFDEMGSVDVPAIIEELEKYYQEEADKLLNTSFGKKRFESKYEEYIRLKAEEKSKAPTLSNKVAGSSAPQVETDFDKMKGTAQGLRYLLKKHKQGE